MRDVWGECALCMEWGGGGDRLCLRDGGGEARSLSKGVALLVSGSGGRESTGSHGLARSPAPCPRPPSPVPRPPSPVPRHPSPVTRHPSPVTRHPSPVAHPPSSVPRPPSPVPRPPSPVPRPPSPVPRPPSPAPCKIFKGLLRYLPSRRIETLSWSPRAFLFHNFLSYEECDHMIKVAGSRVSVMGGGEDWVCGGAVWLTLQLTSLCAPFASCLCNLACLSLYLCSSLCLLPMQPGLPAPLSLQLTRSLVVAQKGGDAVDKVRTSYSASLKWVLGSGRRIKMEGKGLRGTECLAE